MLHPNKPGFILLATLIFLQFYSLLSISMLLRIKNTATINRAILTKTLMTDATKKLFKKLASDWIYNLPSCILEAKDVLDCRERQVIWWQRYACAGNFMGYQYYYVVAKLDEGYYRVILLLMDFNQKAHMSSQILMLKNVNQQHLTIIDMQSILLI